jgi:hypothetical protein
MHLKLLNTTTLFNSGGEQFELNDQDALSIELSIFDQSRIPSEALPSRLSSETLASSCVLRMVHRDYGIKPTIASEVQTCESLNRVKPTYNS